MPGREELVALLRAAPLRLAAAADGLPPERLRARPAPDAWSAVEVLAHLRACADVWGGCVDRLLAEDDPTVRAVNPRTYAEGTGYERLEWAPSFAAYEAQRAGLLRTLETADWSRTATVTGAGRPLRTTVQGYVERLAVHERAHVRQVERTLAG